MVVTLWLLAPPFPSLSTLSTPSTPPLFLLWTHTLLRPLSHPQPVRLPHNPPPPVNHPSPANLPFLPSYPSIQPQILPSYLLWYYSLTLITSLSLVPKSYLPYLYQQSTTLSLHTVNTRSNLRKFPFHHTNYPIIRHTIHQDITQYPIFGKKETSTARLGGKTLLSIPSSYLLHLNHLSQHRTSAAPLFACNHPPCEPGASLTAAIR